MPTSFLGELLEEARRNGFAAGVAPLWSIRHAISGLDWAPISNRAGGSLEQRLRPVEESKAEKRSLSKMAGLGAQPLHTDGAHLRRPPDLVVLSSEDPSSTPTRLLTYKSAALASIGDAPTEGVFLVDGGHDRFLSPVLSNRLRYDPGCMTPCDSRAQAVAAHIASRAEAAIDHVWEANGVLVIDNRRTLHGRAAIEDVESDREIVRWGLVES